jgi:hypothetical protein
VVISEGMISSLNRDELQGVVAHEMAHILRGDSVFLGISASLTNVVYRLADFFRPELSNIELGKKSEDTRLFLFVVGGVYLVFFMAYVLMRFLSCFIGREREEYSPLFIMAPKLRSIDSREGFLGRLFSAHPPMGKRLFNLLSMAHQSFNELQTVDEKSKAVYTLSETFVPAKRTKEKTRRSAMNQLGLWTEPGSWIFNITRAFWCPQCGLSMRRVPYSLAHYVVVDRCLRCESVWFDRHELEALQVIVEDTRLSKTKFG